MAANITTLFAIFVLIFLRTDAYGNDKEFYCTDARCLCRYDDDLALTIDCSNCTDLDRIPDLTMPTDIRIIIMTGTRYCTDKDHLDNDHHLPITCDHSPETDMATPLTSVHGHLPGENQHGMDYDVDDQAIVIGSSVGATVGGGCVLCLVICVLLRRFRRRLMVSLNVKKLIN